MNRWAFDSLSGGLNLADRPDTLEAGQACEALNVCWRGGALRARPGQVDSEDWGLDAPVDALCDDSRGSFYIQSGGKLWRRWEGVTEELWTLRESVDGLINVGTFVPHSNACVYFINGTEFLHIDGSAVQEAEAYIPVYLFTETRLSGLGAVIENRPNFLTDYVRVVYRMANEGTVNTFDLPLECEAGVPPVKVLYNGAQVAVAGISGRRVTLENHYQMDNAVLEVTCKLDIPITTDIRWCRNAVMFGPESRLILFGNRSNRYFVSGAFNPTYFPDDGEHAFGSGDPITGAGKLYDLLVLFKARELAEVRPEDGYLASTINPVIGCDCPGSICTVGNRLVWANSYAGVHMLVSTSRANERNVRSISRNVDKLLLAEPEGDLQAAMACDWDGRYQLCVGERVYVWDYRTRPYAGADEDAAARSLAWYVWEGFDVQYWLPSGARLSYLRRGMSALRELVEGESDCGAAFAVRWKSGAVCPGKAGRYFHADELTVKLPRDQAVELALTVCCDEREENAPHARGSVHVTASQSGYTAERSLPLRLRDARTVSVAFDGTNAGFALQGAAMLWRDGGRVR